ncbi:hypothetical protein VCRA2121O337_90095 [Vibrio crassostreae]|nr:hypothetical protein VCRA2121O337_90095 [Vibrio crassostreae]
MFAGQAINTHATDNIFKKKLIVLISGAQTHSARLVHFFMTLRSL